MPNQIKTNNDSQPSGGAPAPLKHPKAIKPSYYNKNTKTHQEEVGRFGHKRIVRPVAWAVRWVDAHNGVVTAIATGVIAYLTFSLAQDSARQAESANGQLTAIKGQLYEMTKQSKLTIAQLRARVRLDQPAMHPFDSDDQIITSGGRQIYGWYINPHWTNVGSTEAVNFISWWDMKIQELPAGQNKIINLECPDPIKPEKPIAPITIFHDGGATAIAKQLSLQDALAAYGKNSSKVIFMFGYVHYRDIFTTKTHYSNWCFILVPNDLASSTFSFLKARDATDADAQEDSDK